MCHPYNTFICAKLGWNTIYIFSFILNAKTTSRSDNASKQAYPTFLDNNQLLDIYILYVDCMYDNLIFFMPKTRKLFKINKTVEKFFETDTLLSKTDT